MRVFGAGGLVIVGLLAAAFFSLTFVVNRSLSLGDGHWVWSASLRYFWTFVFLTILFLIFGRFDQWKGALGIFRTAGLFWVGAGSIGYGVFYAALCFGADHAPGWLVATIWQSTIVFSPFILVAFGKKVPLKAFLFACIIAIGITVTQLSQVDVSTGSWSWAFGVVPILISAVLYPIGSQLIIRARHGEVSRMSPSQQRLLDNPMVCILLMTLGSMPWWLVLIAVTAPPPPTADEFIGTAVVAFSSGVVGTSLFLWARNSAADSHSVVAVDATQAGEIAFALLLEVFLLGGLWPSLSGWAGILTVSVGLAGFAYFSSKPTISQVVASA